MTSQRAKQILLTWRPDCPEWEDLQVKEALALAETDAELKDWLAKHRSFQERAARSLQNVPVPASLRDAILARAKTVEHRPERAWWSQPMIWAAAAVVAAVIGLASLWTGGESGATVEIFRSRMVNAVLRQYTMDIVTNDMSAVRTFLSKKEAPSDYVLPDKVGRLPVSGAGVLSWQGGKVSMVCLDSPKRGTLFLFVVDAKSVARSGKLGREFADVNQLTAVTWTNGELTYVLAGQGGREELAQYF